MVAGLGCIPGLLPLPSLPLGSAGVSFPKGALPGLDGLTQGVHTSQLCYSLFEKNGRQVVFLGVWLF